MTVRISKNFNVRELPPFVSRRDYGKNTVRAGIIIDGNPREITVETKTILTTESIEEWVKEILEHYPDAEYINRLSGKKTRVDEIPGLIRSAK